MVDYRFQIVDVFAESRYAGNQLAVVRNANELGTRQMQKVAQEFNFSETTFILRNKDSFQVRIFTPKNELPFAGHPTLGTAWVIQQNIIKKRISTVALRLRVGDIPVTFQYRHNKPDVLWMKQKEPTFGQVFEAEHFSKILGIRLEDIDQKFPIRVVSTGIPFFIVPLRDLKSLRSCKINGAYLEDLKNQRARSVLAFSPEGYTKDSDLAVRVFTQYYGIPEDPATGSGNGCLAAYLSRYEYFGSREIDLKVQQGYEIGRPSKLFLKVNSESEFTIMVGGRVFPIAQGTISL